MDGFLTCFLYFLVFAFFLLIMSIILILYTGNIMFSLSVFFELKLFPVFCLMYLIVLFLDLFVSLLAIEIVGGRYNIPSGLNRVKFLLFGKYLVLKVLDPD